MPITILEPIGAGIIVTLISKYIVNNDKLWGFLCAPEKVDEANQEDEDSSSMTTSITGTEMQAHHAHHVY